MRAIRPAAPGGRDILVTSDVALPAPGPDEVHVQVAFAGVNFIDVYQRSGQYSMPSPIPLGREGAGTVLAVGPGVTTLQPGARVAWCDVPGSYAEEIIAPADKLVLVPDTTPLDQAAAVMLQGLTAHYLATSTFPLAAGHRCLIHAAAGGVGLLLCQLARAAGAEVFGTVSTDDKARLATAAGCTHPIRYDRDDFATAVRAIAPAGVDVVYDSVGKTTFDRSLDCLRPRGLLALFGQSSGAVPPVDLQLLNKKGSLFVTRPTLGHYIATRAELESRAAAILGAVAARTLAVRIDQTLPLAHAANAHYLLETRATSGKLLLAI